MDNQHGDRMGGDVQEGGVMAAYYNEHDPYAALKEEPK